MYRLPKRFWRCAPSLPFRADLSPHPCSALGARQAGQARRARRARQARAKQQGQSRQRRGHTGSRFSCYGYDAHCQFCPVGSLLFCSAWPGQHSVVLLFRSPFHIAIPFFDTLGSISINQHQRQQQCQHQHPTLPSASPYIVGPPQAGMGWSTVQVSPANLPVYDLLDGTVPSLSRPTKHMPPCRCKCVMCLLCCCMYSAA